MTWDEAIAAVKVEARSGRGDVEVRGVQYDSRRVTAGDVFVAMRGGTTDGNKFIDAALRKGASAVVTDSAEMYAELVERQPELAVALVEHGRRALAEVSSAVMGRPQDKLHVSAVTGTNGKTTTAYLLEQMLASVGRRCLLIGTIETRVAGEVRASEHTTPESRDLLALFAEAVEAGCTEVVMEASSHALEQGRMWSIPVDVAIFTNLTQDHLDYHGSMAAYARAKMMLFNATGTGEEPRVAVINGDAEYAGDMMLSYSGPEPIMRYAIDDTDDQEHRANYQAVNVRIGSSGTSIDFVTPTASAHIESPLVGRVNVYNLEAAMCSAMARGLQLEQVVSAVANLKTAPGRFEVVPGSREAGYTVVVDYAHTDDALKNLLTLARDLVGTGRVIVMSGCGGDRDKTKRPKMGRVAAAMSDFVVVTSDNPRSEEPMAIIDEVVVGMREELGMYAGEFVVEPDRRAAIEVAIRAAKPGDIVLLAGKGHEKVQIFADGAVPFDDVEEAARVLRVLRIEEA